MGERGRLMRRVGDNPVTGTDVDELMRSALEETRTTYPHPNPRVGAVLTSPNGTVVAVAAHQSAGQPHAEVLALEAAEDATGCTLTVTLEPCNHHGATPPCTDAIINAGITKVIVGLEDPDDRVSGAGIERLRKAGIDVTVGVLAGDIIANDPGYFHHRATRLPMVTLKLASTLDGQIGAADGTSKWITSPEARKDAHQLRAQNDVVIVGVGTVIEDDPLLDVRIDGFEGRQPQPVIIAGTRDIPPDRRILNRDPIIYRPIDGQGVDPVLIAEDLGERGFVSAMIEGGPSIASSFLRAGLVDRLVWYIAAKLAGGRGLPAMAGVFETIDDVTDIDITDVARVGPDIRISATISKER
jgi:diaminohydroxyphosphoribosylaminopyrimidine deaminase/5-amino-6-(5-phosphoribosylamino)uracil reductase